MHNNQLSRWNIWILVNNGLICLYLTSRFSELFTSGFPTFNNLSIFSNLFTSNFLSIRILKIVLCARAVFGELLQLRSILFRFLYFLVIPIRKRPYLSQITDNQKNKSTLLCQTLKVGQENVPSEIRFVTYWLRYGRFLIFAIQ